MVIFEGQHFLRLITFDLIRLLFISDFKFLKVVEVVKFVISRFSSINAHYSIYSFVSIFEPNKFILKCTKNKLSAKCPTFTVQ